MSGVDGNDARAELFDGFLHETVVLSQLLGGKLALGALFRLLTLWRQRDLFAQIDFQPDRLAEMSAQCFGQPRLIGRLSEMSVCLGQTQPDRGVGGGGQLTLRGQHACLSAQLEAGNQVDPVLRADEAGGG